MSKKIFWSRNLAQKNFQPPKTRKKIQNRLLKKKKKKKKNVKKISLSGLRQRSMTGLNQPLAPSPSLQVSNKTICHFLNHSKSVQPRFISVRD